MLGRSLLLLLLFLLSGAQASCTCDDQGITAYCDDWGGVRDISRLQCSGTVQILISERGFCPNEWFSQKGFPSLREVRILSSDECKPCLCSERKGFVLEGVCSCDQMRVPKVLPVSTLHPSTSGMILVPSPSSPQPSDRPRPREKQPNRRKNERRPPTSSPRQSIRQSPSATARQDLIYPSPVRGVTTPAPTFPPSPIGFTLDPLPAKVGHRSSTFAPSVVGHALKPSLDVRVETATAKNPRLEIQITSPSPSPDPSTLPSLGTIEQVLETRAPNTLTTDKQGQKEESGVSPILIGVSCAAGISSLAVLIVSGILLRKCWLKYRRQQRRNQRMDMDGFWLEENYQDDDAF